MLNYDYLIELAENDEMQEEILQRMWNLLTLLDIKKQLGDLVDITDRLFGYLLYHEEGNAPFVFSTLAVIFALSEELEARIEDSQWSSKDWEAEGYPHMDSEYIYSVYVPFECSKEEMEAFKTFLKPGDRLNVQAVFSQKITVTEEDGFGGIVKNQIDTFKTETVFGDIMVADLLNNRGESILDIYAGYRELSVWDQASLDASQSFKDKTSPRTLLVALTPEEKERYYYYMSKTNVEFKVSMPQRVE